METEKLPTMSELMEMFRKAESGEQFAEVCRLEALIISRGEQ